MTQPTSSAPVIVTERLELWQPAATDAYRMLEIVSDPRTARHLGARSTPSDHFVRFQRNAGSWFLFGYGGMMVRLKGTGECIGNCGIFHSWRGLGEDFDDQPEAGWILSADHVGQGYGAEAMTAIFEWFDRTHGPRRVVALIAPENTPSIALSRRFGFVPMRDAAMPDGEAVTLFERAAP